MTRTIRDEELENMSYEEAIELTLERFDEIEDTKRRWIIILAKKLEKLGTPNNMISQKISRDLEGRVNSGYVRNCLGKDYKDAKQVREHCASQSRDLTRADDCKNVLVGITNNGNQETAKELPTPTPEGIAKTSTLHRQDDDQITIYSLQNKLREIEERNEYLAKKLAERSPELPDLYEKIRELEEIETERIKNDFVSAESLNVTNNHLQQEISSLREKIDEQESLLSIDTFYAELEIKGQIIPVTIIIDRKTRRAKVTVNTPKVKRSIS